MNKQDKERLDRIENKIDLIAEKLDNYNSRLVKVETVQSGLVRISAVLGTTFIGYIVKLVMGA